MPWTGGNGAGFTDPEVKPWLPLGDNAARNVEDQRANAQSTLAFVQQVIALRRSSADLHAGSYVQLPSPPETWTYRRGERATIALNLSARELAIGDVRGVIRLATQGGREGERVSGDLRLAPWEGVVCFSESM